MKKTVFLGLLMLISFFVCNAQEYTSHSIIKEESVTSKTVENVIGGTATCESPTYEGARALALSKAITDYFNDVNKTDVKTSIDENYFMMYEEMDLNVVILIQKTPEGKFKAHCKLYGKGEQRVKSEKY